VAAQLRTFLLESVLVCRQSVDESNFHVFYQIVRGAGMFCETVVIRCNIS
jgi:myosin heavy subunit